MKKGEHKDAGKIRVDLFPVAGFMATSQALEFGTSKYGDYNWQQGIEYRRIYASTIRHMMAWYGGQDLDPESGLSHVAHASCNIQMLLHYIANPEEYGTLDDRPHKL